MFYINTTRGWRPLHKLHYQLAESWREKGWAVEEHVAKLSPFTYWVSEYNFRYSEVKTRLIYSARQRAKKSGILFRISESDFEIPKACPLRHRPFKVGINQHTDDSPTLDRKDPRLGYVKGNVWVISHKANRMKGDFTPNELKTFCETVLELDWINWTSDDEEELREALQRQRAERMRRMNEKLKPRWWALWGAPKSRSEITHGGL